MKKVAIVLLCFVILFIQPSIHVLAEKETDINFSLYAKSAVLMDADSGRVLFEKEGYQHMPNASTTKIMTCLLTIESGKMEDVATVSSYAASMPKVHLGMKEGQKFKVRDLLYSLMLESHNDSAVVIAEHVAGSVEAFATMMNEKAKELGCEDTYFITPNGLDAEDKYGVHGTTARDLAVIMSCCLKNETFLEITRTPSYTLSDVDGTRQYSCYNRNSFLTMMDGALSGKTGFTGDAGYCYVGALRQGNRTFVVALLACGWPNNKTYKWTDTKNLMNYALDNYHYQEVFEHEKQLSEILVEEALPKEWELYQNIYVTPRITDCELMVLKKETEKIHVVYDIPKTVKAPIKAGEQIGEVSYFLDEKCIGKYPITVSESVKKKTKKWYFDYVVHEFYQWISG